MISCFIFLQKQKKKVYIFTLSKTVQTIESQAYHNKMIQNVHEENMKLLYILILA